MRVLLWVELGVQDGNRLRGGSLPHGHRRQNGVSDSLSGNGDHLVSDGDCEEEDLVVQLPACLRVDALRTFVVPSKWLVWSRSNLFSRMKKFVMSLARLLIQSLTSFLGLLINFFCDEVELQSELNRSHACAPRFPHLTPGVHQHLIGGRPGEPLTPNKDEATALAVEHAKRQLHRLNRCSCAAIQPSRE